uniref:Uncharacterized protein TCIL3000_9_6020 n=1 Tax=Trypanosoma congolense (strain IL3000) TaxID=1068625 RepID=G0UUY0_TRYCI|nr:unnamed protein product [Trypanosoma congolense IL3000]
MEVLKEVLRVDSHVPLIRASEERLLALAAKEREENECKTVHDEKGSLQKAALNTQDFDCGGVNEDNGSKQKKKNNNRNKKRGKKNSPPEEPLERGNSAPQDTNSFDHRSSCGIVGGNSRRSEYLLNHDPADGKCARSRRDQCERGHANRRMNSREERREPAGVAVTTATRSVTETATEVPSQRRGLLEGFDLPINVPLFSTHPDMQKGMLVRPTSADPHRHAVSKQLQQLFALQNEQLHGEHQGPTSNKRGNGESNSTEVRTSSGTLRFTSNSKDGGALLRHLQAALNTTEKGGDRTSTKRT